MQRVCWEGGGVCRVCVGRVGGVQDVYWEGGGECKVCVLGERGEEEDGTVYLCLVYGEKKRERGNQNGYSSSFAHPHYTHTPFFLPST